MEIPCKYTVLYNAETKDSVTWKLIVWKFCVFESVSKDF